MSTDAGWRDVKPWDNDRTFEGVVSQEVRDSYGTILPLDEIERAMPAYMEYGTLNDTHTNMIRGYPVAWKRENDKIMVRFGVMARGVNDDKFWGRVKSCKGMCGLSPGFDYTEELPGARLAGLTIFEISHLAPGHAPSNPGAWVTGVNGAARSIRASRRAAAAKCRVDGCPTDAEFDVETGGGGLGAYCGQHFMELLMAMGDSHEAAARAASTARDACCGSCASGLEVCDDELDTLERAFDFAATTGRPFGPWAGFDDCMNDPKMIERYPDEERRKKVCGALKSRLESRVRQPEFAIRLPGVRRSEPSNITPPMSLSDGMQVAAPATQVGQAPAAAPNADARIAALERDMAEIKTLLQGMSSGGRAATPAAPTAAAAPAAPPVAPPQVNASGDAAMALLTQTITRMDARQASLEGAVTEIRSALAQRPASQPPASTPPAAPPAAPAPQTRGTPSEPGNETAVPSYGFVSMRKANRSPLKTVLGIERPMEQTPQGAAPAGGRP